MLFVSQDDVSDVGAWSGTPFHMYRAIEGVVTELVRLSPLRQRGRYPLKAVEVARNRVAGSVYQRYREPLVLDGYRRQIADAVAEHAPDVVLSPSTIPVTRLDGDVPVVVWTDATFAGLLDYYPEFSDLSPRTVRQGHDAERRALRRASLVVYTSAWAADSARDDYGLDPERAAVVPYGANLGEIVAPPRDEVPRPVRLLLVGDEWHRKGIDRAADLLAELGRRGVDATLDVVGCTPPAGTTLADGVRVHPYLSKADPDQAATLDGLFRDAAFFVLPARADCTPLVLAEAQAYGLPILAAATGGIPSMVAPGGGSLFGGDDYVPGAAGAVEQMLADPEGYAAMSRRAREHYEATFRWSRAARRVFEEIAARIPARA